MTTNELFEEYAELHKSRMQGNVGERQRQIIQEVEALVRKETIEDILQWGEEINYGLDEGVRAYAGVKGITL